MRSRGLTPFAMAQLGAWAGGMDYAAVGQAVSRFGRLLEKSRELCRQLDQVEHQLSNVET